MAEPIAVTERRQEIEPYRSVKTYTSKDVEKIRSELTNVRQRVEQAPPGTQYTLDNRNLTREEYLQYLKGYEGKISEYERALQKTQQLRIKREEYLERLRTGQLEPWERTKAVVMALGQGNENAGYKKLQYYERLYYSPSPLPSQQAPIPGYKRRVFDWIQKGKNPKEAVAQVLFEEMTKEDTGADFYDKLNPVEQVVTSFFEGAKGIVYGGLGFVPYVVGQAIPGTDPIEQAVEKEFAYMEAQRVGPRGAISEAYAQIPEEVPLLGATDEQREQAIEEREKYPLGYTAATFGEVAGLYASSYAGKSFGRGIKAGKSYIYGKYPRVGSVASKFDYYRPRNVAIRGIKKTIRKAPSKIGKLYSPKIVRSIYAKVKKTSVGKGVKEYSLGYKKGIELPLSKRKVARRTAQKAGFTTDYYTKIETFRGRGKKIWLSPEEVIKGKPGARKSFFTKGTQRGPYFDLIQIADITDISKPKGFLFKKVKKTFKTADARKTELTGKYIPEKYQLLAPEQKISVAKTTRKGLGSIERPALAEGLPRLESQTYKPGTLTYKETVRKGTPTYYRGKEIPGPLSIEGYLGKDFLMYEPKIGFTMREPVTKVTKTPTFYAPEFAPQLYGYKWKPTPKSITKKVISRTKQLAKEVKAEQPIAPQIEIPKQEVTYKVPGKRTFRAQKLSPTTTTIRVPVETQWAVPIQAVALGEISTQTQRIKLAEIQKPKQITVPIPAQESIRISALAQTQKQPIIQEQVYKLKQPEPQKQKTMLYSPYRAPVIPTTPKIRIPFAEERKKPKRKQGTKGYNVQVYNKGRWVTANPETFTTKKQALGFGADHTDKTRPYKFRIVETGKQGKDQPIYNTSWSNLNYKFKKVNNNFVEKKKYREDFDIESQEYRNPRKKASNSSQKVKTNQTNTYNAYKPKNISLGFKTKNRRIKI